eukprot:TRINITY_DN2391_c0_g1_i2.p1 TRINITY_DN2391_c0_g1~~TRINITY_DN2391_c0_g1_i2.p1  ORF type:complete len:1134 (-),score=226.70 TRINITY_DN2391_c0_g1_i2:15-3416(-)
MSKPKSSTENIQVIVRCRPMSKQEMADKQLCVCTTNEKDKEIIVNVRSSKFGTTKSFYFDSVYGPKSTQRDIYMGTVLPIVQEVLEGYNCTLFAYGQTGTGKTYTMAGLRDTEPGKSRINTDAGIITRSINTIFDTLKKGSEEYTVKVSHLELYNEELCDLLNPENKALKIYEDINPNNGCSAINVHNLTEVVVYNAEEIFTILDKSWNERRTGETLLNDFSSRSHCIFSITILMRENTSDGEEVLKMGKLNLVDLAGSENIGKSGAKNVAKTEAGMINKSLLTLGRVITSLTEKSPHIPYRESKLTRLLQDSLGGSTKTCIIATISPASGGYDETMSTLDYAFRAKNIRNQPQVNKKVSKKEVIQEYTEQITDLRAQLDAARRKDGVYLPLDQYERMVSEITLKTQLNLALQDTIDIKDKELAEINDHFVKQEEELTLRKAQLEEIKSNLDQKVEQLKVTENQLQSKTIQLNEKLFVLNEYKITEQRIRSDVEQLHSIIRKTVSEIEALHKKNERMDLLVGDNKNSFSEVKAVLIETVIFLEKQLKIFLIEQNNKHAEFIQKLEKLIQKSHADISQIGVLVQSVNLETAQTLHNVSENGHGYLMKQSTIAEDVHQLADNTRKDIESISSSFISQSKGQVDQIQNEISNFQQASLKQSQQTVGIINESQSCVNEFVQNQTTTLTGLEETIDNKISTGVTKLDNCGSYLNQFIKQQEQVEYAHMNWVVEQVKILLQKSANDRLNKINGTVNEMKNNIQGTIAEFSNLKNIYATANNDATSKCSQFSQNISTQYTSLTSTLKDSYSTTTSSFVSSLQSDLLKYTQMTDQLGSVLTNTTKEQTTKQQELMKQMQHQSEEFVQKQDSQFNAVVSENSAKVINIGRQLEQLGNFVITEGTQSIEGVKKQLNTNSNFQRQYSSYSAQNIEKSNAINYKPYASTDQTPSKGPLTSPPQVTKMRPESELIAYYRSTNPTSQSLTLPPPSPSLSPSPFPTPSTNTKLPQTSSSTDIHPLPFIVPDSTPSNRRVPLKQVDIASVTPFRQPLPKGGKRGGRGGRSPMSTRHDNSMRENIVTRNNVTNTKQQQNLKLSKDKVSYSNVTMMETENRIDMVSSGMQRNAIIPTTPTVCNFVQKKRMM